MSIKPDTNFKLRVYEKCNLAGALHPRGMGLLRVLDPHWKNQLLVVPRVDGTTLMLYGDGHIRMGLKSEFKNILGTDNPTFEQAWDYMTNRKDIAVERVKDKVIKI